jgi:flagellar biosynthesis protein
MRIAKYYNHKKRKEMNGPSAAVIKYEEGIDSGPQVVARGKGQVAEKIIALAKQSNVHVEEDPTLLENLLDMDLGDNLPPQLYGVMAEILLLIEEMDRNY